MSSGRGFGCANGNRTDGRVETRGERQLQAELGRVPGSNILIPQCSAPTLTFPQAHYRRGLKRVATPPPLTC